MQLLPPAEFTETDNYVFCKPYDQDGNSQCYICIILAIIFNQTAEYCSEIGRKAISVHTVWCESARRLLSCNV